MKITRSQLKQLIKEEIELEEDATEILTTSVAQHIQVLLDKAWPKADFHGSPTVNANMPNANRFVLTYKFATVGTASGLSGLNAVTRTFKSKVAGQAAFKSRALDNSGNKIFKMKLANDNPVSWDGDDKKDADRYVALRIHVTLMDKFMDAVKADPSIITSGETETISISENENKITRRQLKQLIKEEVSIVDTKINESMKDFSSLEAMLEMLKGKLTTGMASLKRGDVDDSIKWVQSALDIVEFAIEEESGIETKYFDAVGLDERHNQK
jgi:hypothetical protein